MFYRLKKNPLNLLAEESFAKIMFHLEMWGSLNSSGGRGGSNTVNW